MTDLKRPDACTEGERRAFARLVLQGFPAAQRLDERIREANCLAFRYAADDSLAAVAALKAPPERYRHETFAQAVAPANGKDYELELGWVFVVPAHRGRGMARSLCEHLVARVPEAPVFATTRPDNTPMIRILRALGFERAGKPYLHSRRDQRLVLFLRSRRGPV